MKFWLLERRPGAGGYDEAQGFVVRATSAHTARTIASQHAGDEGGDTWLLPPFSSCIELHVDGTEAIILRDFRAG